MTRPALPYDYTCFADGTYFEKEFLRSSFDFLNVVFYYTILNKTDFFLLNVYINLF